jgi:hypothetical protein
VAYSVPLWERTERLAELRGRWLPYDDELRATRLAEARMFVLNDLDHVPLMIRRDEPFHAFHRHYLAFQGFLHALFIARRRPRSSGRSSTHGRRRPDQLPHGGKPRGSLRHIPRLMANPGTSGFGQSQRGLVQPPTDWIATGWPHRSTTCHWSPSSRPMRPERPVWNASYRRANDARVVVRTTTVAACRLGCMSAIETTLNRARAAARWIVRRTAESGLAAPGYGAAGPVSLENGLLRPASDSASDVPRMRGSPSG